MFAPKDISSLNSLGRNLGQIVQNQFRNDLFAANQEREQARKGTIQSAIQGFSKVVNDPAADINAKRAAKANTLAILAGMGATEEANVIDKAIDFKSPNLQYIQGGPGEERGTFNPESGEFKPTGTNPSKPVEPDYEYLPKTVKRDGIIYRQKRAVDKFTRQPIPNLPTVEEPWSQERDDSWMEKLMFGLDLKTRREVSERTKSLLNKTRELEDEMKYLNEIEKSPTAGSKKTKPTDDDIVVQRAQNQAAREAIQKNLDEQYQELTEIEKQYGQGMIKNPAGAGSTMPGAQPTAPKAVTPAQAPQADQFEVGKMYEDGDGNRAKYLGNGKWQEIPK